MSGSMSRGRTAVSRSIVSRLFVRTLLGTTVLIGISTAQQASAQSRVVGACSGVQLRPSAVTGILSPVLTGITGPIESRVNSILGLPLISALLPGNPTLNTDLTNLLNDAANGQPITLQALASDGTLVGPTDECRVTADALTLDTPAGISIGGNQIVGLGANGTPSFASDINAIAFGNNARAEAGATGSIAIGANSQATAANSIALGAGSLAGRGALGGYTAVGLTGTQASAGEVSVGSPTALRQITNVAAGSAPTDAATVGQVAGVAANAVNYTDPTRTRATLAGTAGTVIDNLAPGTLAATSTEAVNGSQLFATNTQVGTNTTAIVNAQTSITALQGQAANAVRYDTDAGGTRTGRVTLAGATPGQAVTLDNVAPGALSATSAEAVNGSQLFATNTQVGTNTTAIAGIDTRVTTNTQDIATLQGQTANAVRYDVDAGGVRTGGVTLVPTVAGQAVTLGNVAAGALSATSTDAVNGSQLFATNTQVAANTTAIGTNTAAIGAIDTRVTTNTTNIAGLDTRVTTNTQDITTLQGQTANAVRYDTDAAGNRTGGVTLVSTVPGQAVTIGNVAAGALSATSTDAVNGSQLFATNTQVATNTTSIGAIDTRVTNNTTAITNLDNRITNNTQDIANAVRYDVDAAGNRTGGVTLVSTVPGQAVTIGNVAAGALSATSTDAVNGSQLFATNTQVATNTTAIGNNTTAITNLDNRITTNTQDIANAVRYDVDAAGNRTGGITLVSTTPGQAVTIGNVAAGTLSATSTDAVNGSQLFATNDRLDTTIASLAGFDTRITANTDGLAALRLSALQYDNAARDRITLAGAAGTVLANVGAGTLSATSTEAVNGSQLFATNLQVAANTSAIAQIGNGSAGPVRYSTPGAPTTPNGGTVTNDLTLVGTGTDAVALHNVAAGTLAAGSTDAVNGGQLNTTNQAVAALDNRVTAGEGRITTLETNVANNSGAITAIDARVTDNSTAITNLQNNAAGTNTTVNNLTTQVTSNTNAITNLQTQVGNQPLKYADAATPTTPNGGTLTDDATLVGAGGGAVGLHNVRAGALVAGSTDAVNGGQLAETNAQVAANTSAITTLSNVVAGSTVSAVQYSNPGSPTTPNGGIRTNDVTLVGVNAAAPVGLHNVANGVVAAGSTDAVNGGQLNTVTTQLNAVAAQSANSLQYDRDATGARTNRVTLAGGNAAAPVTIANVAAGTVAAGSTQAVNGGQLHATNQTAVAALALGANSVQYDGTGNVTFGAAGSSAPVALRNVAAGTSPTDAVNLAQLQSGMRSVLGEATTYIDSRLAAVGFDLNNMRRDMAAGSSAAMAVAALPQPMEPGATMVSIGGGTYRGQSAIAFGASRAFNDGRAVVKVGGTMDSQGYAGANAGVGFQF